MGMALGRQVLQLHEETIGADPAPYGIASNLAMLTTLCQFSLTQGLIRTAVTVPDLFATSVS
jgi:hypothetical protein